MIKSAFPSCNFVHSSFFVAILASQQQKSENQKILYSPVGGLKKTTEFVSPQKESFGKSKLVESFDPKRT